MNIPSFDKNYGQKIHCFAVAAQKISASFGGYQNCLHQVQQANPKSAEVPSCLQKLRIGNRRGGLSGWLCSSQSIFPVIYISLLSSISFLDSKYVKKWANANRICHHAGIVGNCNTGSKEIGWGFKRIRLGIWGFRGENKLGRVGFGAGKVLKN